MKRFYKLVTTAPSENGFGIFLDGRPVKTPAKNLLICANERLAAAAADEWAQQGEHILPDAMPVNQLLITALDNLRPRQEIEQHILGFIDTDLICYHSDQSPYKETQAEKWGKWTSWFEGRYGVPVKKTDAIAPLTQAPEIHRIFAEYLAVLDLLSLVTFESLVDETSSPFLSLAFFEKEAGPDDLYAAVLIEDLIKAKIYDEEKYGAAPDQEKKRGKISAMLKAAEKILAAL